MIFSISLGKIFEAEGTLVFFVQEGKPWPDELKEADKLLGGYLRITADLQNFQAKTGEFLFLHTHGKIPASFVFLAGLGKTGEFDLYKCRKIFGKIAKKSKEIKINHLIFSSLSHFGKELAEKFGIKNLVQAGVEGLILGDYKFLKYKGEEERKKEKKIEEVTFLADNAKEKIAIAEGVSLGEIMARATVFARDLVNEPAAKTTPDFLAGVAGNLAKGDIKCRIFKKDDCRKLGMNAFLAVSQGSNESPKFIRLDYRPSGLKEKAPKIVLVGKGITFDAGGLSLKTAEHMETMKMDMAGTAAVLAVFSVLAKLNPQKEIIGLCPVCENMPSGTAIKPGDVVTAYNGKTIEILNTDAEGRLTLADVLSYGVSLKPDCLIDLATLTGACIVALGEDIAAVMGNNRKLTEEIKKAGEKAGEKFWELPLEKDYKEMLKSEVADLANSSKKRAAGTILGGLFLEEFVGDIPWAHIDIAGPAFCEKETDFIPKGGSGFGVRTILNFIYDSRN